MLNLNTAHFQEEQLDTIPLETLCDFEELFDHTSRLVEKYSDNVLFVCSCSHYRKHANCHHLTILSILTGPKFTLPDFLDERKIAKHAKKDAKSLTYAERARDKATERRKEMVYTLLTSSEVTPCSPTLSCSFPTLTTLSFSLSPTG